MERGYIRSAAVRAEPLNVLQDWYVEVLDALGAARQRRDSREVVRLLVDRELLREVIDERVDDLLQGSKRPNGERDPFGVDHG